MVNFKTLTVALAAMTLVACSSDSNNSDPVRPSGVESGADTDSDISTDLALDPSGESVMSATVTEVTVGEQAVDESLADELATLQSITRVVETDAGTFDFYAGDTLVMTVGDDGIIEEGGDIVDLSILASIEELVAEDIRFSSAPGATEQDASTGMFEFDLSFCEAVEEEQAQNQNQAQDKEEAQNKGEQAQDKDEPVEQNQAQNQAQNKETGEDKEVAQDCTTITVSMEVEEVMEEVKQEQAQDKEQEQAQDKEEPVEQAQDKGEEAQDKGDQEQAQDKGDQEQAEPKA